MRCKSEACLVVVEYIIPACAICLTNALYLVSLSAVWKAHRIKSLGPLNPTIFPYQANLGLAFILYALYLQDLTIFLGNVFGLLSGLVYACLCLPLASQGQVRHMVTAIFATFSATLTASLFSVIILAEYNDVPTASSCVLALILFYASPILNIRRVIASRNSSSIYLPLATLSVLTSSSVSFISYHSG